MRELKFRAWDKEGKRWYQNAPVIQQLHTDHTWTLYSHIETVVLLQYTGLKDKNGKEIYEGDLIKDTDSSYVGEVIWDAETLCFTTKFKTNELWGFVPRHGKDNHCEIIGNIYQDKHLLGKMC